LLNFLTLLGAPDTTCTPTIRDIIRTSANLALDLSNEDEIYRGYMVARCRTFLDENMIRDSDSGGLTNIVLVCTFPGLYKRIDTDKLLALVKAEVVLVHTTSNATLL
jgi:hypothetical protein